MGSLCKLPIWLLALLQVQVVTPRRLCPQGMALDIGIPDKPRHPFHLRNIWSPRTRMTDTKVRSTAHILTLPRRPHTIARGLGERTRQLPYKR
jgi:hypothetical protein